MEKARRRDEERVEKEKVRQEKEQKKLEDRLERCMLHTLCLLRYFSTCRQLQYRHPNQSRQDLQILNYMHCPNSAAHFANHELQCRVCRERKRAEDRKRAQMESKRPRYPKDDAKVQL